MEKLIKTKRSVIVACDVSSLIKLEYLITATCRVKGIGGYKIGSLLVLRYGLENVVDIIRANTITSDNPQPIIYDHQKASTDIPELGKEFGKVCKSGKVDAVILFPFGGAATEKAWIAGCRDYGLTVLVGGHMTQPEFLSSEGGFIADDAPERIFKIAMENGVRDFVVPGNKVEYVSMYRQLFVDELGEGNFTLYAPGFIAQGGVITETGKVAGENWHAIVGSAIYKAPDIKKAAEEITSQILS